MKKSLESELLSLEFDRLAAYTLGQTINCWWIDLKIFYIKIRLGQ